MIGKKLRMGERRNNHRKGEHRTQKLEEEEMRERWKKKKTRGALYVREIACLLSVRRLKRHITYIKTIVDCTSWSQKKNCRRWGKGNKSSTSELAFCSFSRTLATKPPRTIVDVE